uniref:CGG triplet repeat-binding protein 1 n=1 Tax=Latimeria chalumnae TaxID=7897 RepID=H3ABP5_LATCH
NSKKAKNMSASDRVKQYPLGVLHSDGGKLFCTYCNVTVDHYRKSFVDRHLDSSTHRKRKVEIQSTTANDSLAKKQKTKSTKSREARNYLNFELTEVCVCANIPLEKLDNKKLHKFLRRHVTNGGVIPSSAQLRFVDKLTSYYDPDSRERTSRFTQ